MSKSKPDTIVYKVHTDGSALGNPGPGGYALVVRCGDAEVVTLSKGYFKTTNNRMELLAIIVLLETYGAPGNFFDVYTDSMYVIDGATKWHKSWARNNWITWRTQQPVKNADLWKRVEPLLKANKVKFTHVRAHTGIPDNEMADKLAKEAAAAPTEIDEGFMG
jgi:ribonuclease HI